MALHLIWWSIWLWLIMAMGVAPLLLLLGIWLWLAGWEMQACFAWFGALLWALGASQARQRHRIIN